MAKNDAVWNDYYSTHLNGGRKSNRGMNQQAMTEQMYVRLLTELCANRFEWVGFPDSVNKRFLELNLIWRGLVAFYRDEDAGEFFVAQASGSGATNFMDEPTALTIIGPGMLAKTLSTVTTRQILPDGEVGDAKKPECVPIFCNFMRTPDLDVIYLYATKLAKIDRSIEITADNMRKPKVVAASENERVSALNALKQINEGQDAIFVTDGGALGSMMSVLDLGVDPLTLPNLMVAKSKLWNECMGLLGINNSNQEKKERLVAAEVGANDEQVQATKNIALNARRIACEQIKLVFGIDVTVDFVKEEVEPADGEQQDTDKAGGKDTEKDAA